MNITHEQFAKALRDNNVHATGEQINRVMNAVLPNPQSGFGGGGVQVWGDTRSIAAVRLWHHDSAEVVPALRERLKGAA